MMPYRCNNFMFDQGVAPALRGKPPGLAIGQLMEAERMAAIGSMACWVSHDMRHLLAPIYANAEFLEHHDIGVSERADLLREIRHAVLAMTERIDSLLQFGKSGRREFVKAPVSLVIEKAIVAVKCHPDGRKVSITAGKLPSAEADIDVKALESAIYNLLLNACQAAAHLPRLPEVEVYLTEVEERIYITILDNGPGIHASVRETLFDPFVTRGTHNGQGLGLSLARRIAEEHGGGVCLEQSTGERTAFTLSLTKNRSLPSVDLNRAERAPSLRRSLHGMLQRRRPRLGVARRVMATNPTTTVYFTHYNPPVLAGARRRLRMNIDQKLDATAGSTDEGTKVIYTAKTHTSGGRRGGVSRSDDQRLDLKFGAPGIPGSGTNPEQLFAAGWSACFISAMGHVASKMKVKLPPDTAVDAEIDLCNSGSAYFLQARLNVSLPGLEREVAQAIVAATHAETCAYSNATRGNIDVTLNVV